MVENNHGSYLGLQGPFIMAHRGGGLESPENSRVAINNSKNSGILVIESDVHATSDDVAVLMHDALLNRTTEASGRVRDFTYQQIIEYNDISGEHILSLEEALRNFPELRFNIDVKSFRALEPFVDTIKRIKAWDRVCAASFSTKRLEYIRNTCPEIQCSAGTKEISFIVLSSILPLKVGVYVGRKIFKGKNVAALQIPFRFKGIIPVATKRFIRQGHALGLQVHVWTVNKEKQMLKVWDNGADAVITDLPKRAMSVLAAWRAQKQKQRISKD